MKIAITGATGRMGQRLLAHALRAGHEVTALVRSREKLLSQLGGSVPERLSIAVSDAEDPAALGAVLDGKEAAIQCALTPSYGERFFALNSAFTRLAEERMVGARRVWMFGGVGALAIPGTALLAVDLMRPIFQVHRRNWETLRASSLDWSFACPGAMVQGQAAPVVHTSLDVIPVDPPGDQLGDTATLTRWFGEIFPFITISFDDVSRTIVENLAADGPLSRHRVGFVLPASQERVNEWSRAMRSRRAGALGAT